MRTTAHHTRVYEQRANVNGRERGGASLASLSSNRRCGGRESLTRSAGERARRPDPYRNVQQVSSTGRPSRIPSSRDSPNARLSDVRSPPHTTHRVHSTKRSRHPHDPHRSSSRVATVRRDCPHPVYSPRMRIRRSWRHSSARARFKYKLEYLIEADFSWIVKCSSSLVTFKKFLEISRKFPKISLASNWSIPDLLIG